LAPVLQIVMDVNVSTSTKESVMSQKVNEKQNPKDLDTSKQPVQEPPITGLSPDDDVGVKSDGGGNPQPGQIQK
jgi:hypothetical protein